MSVYIEKTTKTKKLIQQCFIELLTEKPFDTITIGDLAKQAHINRGTFYLHYIDKYDLLEQIELELFKNLGNHIDELQASYSTKSTFEAGQAQLSEALFRSIEKHAPILKVLLSNNSRAGFHLRFKQAISDKVRMNIEANAHIIEKLKAPMDYFISFITAAFLGLVEQWVQSGLDKSPREMTDLYIDIISFIQKK